MSNKTKDSTKKNTLWALLLVVLTKGKVLLTTLLKLKGIGTFISMVISTFAYWWAWHLGVWGAVGFVVSIWCHEMGHVYGARKVGLPVTAPVFIPFLGAMIRMKESPRNARDEAFMALAGPVAGSLAAFACLGIYMWTDARVWLWLAAVGTLINLFNLIPVMPLDGGRIAVLFGRSFWWLGLAILVLLSFVMQSPLLLLFAYLGLEEINRRFVRLPSWVFFVPVILSLVQAVFFEHFLEGYILGLILFILASLRVYFGGKNEVEYEVEHDQSYFNVSTGQKAMILGAYLGLIGLLGASYWWLHGLLAAIQPVSG